LGPLSGSLRPGGPPAQPRVLCGIPSPADLLMRVEAVTDRLRLAQGVTPASLGVDGDAGGVRVARRITPAQARARLRQAQSKARQAAAKLKKAVNDYTAAYAR
jgi:hypothetical protein